MKISQLSEIFLNALKSHMPDWTFVKGQRTFKKSDGDVRLFFHITQINHSVDFAAKGDVAVEIKSQGNRVCIVGAQLANISGEGLQRFNVIDEQTAHSSARDLYESFVHIGIPFLEEYQRPEKILETLKRGGSGAMLISPLRSQHFDQIRALEGYLAA